MAEPNRLVRVIGRQLDVQLIRTSAAVSLDPDHYLPSPNSCRDAIAIIKAIEAEGGSVSIPLSNEELAEAGLEAVAEFEREYGPIPDEVVADIKRRWA